MSISSTLTYRTSSRSADAMLQTNQQEAKEQGCGLVVKHMLSRHTTLGSVAIAKGKTQIISLISYSIIYDAIIIMVNYF